MPRKGGSTKRRTKESRGTRVPEAYAKLRELIVRGQLAPGTRIIETDIAERLGISRTPVRGALQRLQQEGYIASSGSGLQSRLAVAPLTQQDARELFGIVAQIEALAARWAAVLAPVERGALVDELTALNDALHEEATLPRPDHQRLFDIDQQFHHTFVEAGGGPRLRALHEAVKPQSERYVRLYISALVDEIGESVDEHAATVRAIGAGDGAAADAAVVNNWRNAADRLCRVIGSLGERGAW
jgi:DNA-binding GntR family transcriptional regulator